MRYLIALVFWVVSFVIAAPLFAQSWPVLKQEREELDKDFRRLWNDELVWKFDELPTKAYVPKHRVPYAGSIYPDNVGGTWQACRKYDRAFYGGRNRAEAYEAYDIRIHSSYVGYGGFFSRGGYYTVPYWSGHCNGWTAAAIRHAEPKYSVKHNGVMLTPKDIKGLLAEVYTFCDTVMLGGSYNNVINPASFHVSLANWVGRKDHPIAMETTPGTEIWNFPVYAYNTAIKKHRDYVDVKVTMAYKHYLEREEHKAPASVKHKYFHYYLNLDKDGKIVGGDYYYDSNVIDFLWVPLAPAQGGQKGNLKGNPHIKLEEVLAIWRKSVHDDKLIAKWQNIDSTVPVVAEPDGTVAKAGD
ncbi:MAG: hypothetical protein MI757_09660 [Pirellulales bacterium]|nr:hypothetical protein [Pirellulales bacterium]